MSRLALQGLTCWHYIQDFIELRENFRWKLPTENTENDIKELPFILQRARVGKITQNEVDYLNDKCYFNNEDYLQCYPSAL